jgi:hypothetical protein
MTDFGPKPIDAELPVSELAVDSSYQRSIEARRNQAAIERICENFRWSLFGKVTVTKGLTGYLIIDGQHRAEAARRLKIATVPCLIVPPLSRQDQALAFVAANRDRVSVTGFAIYHALVAAGDESATAMARVCMSADVEVARYPMPISNMQPRQTLSVASIRNAVVLHGEASTIKALKIIRQAFPNEPGALRAHLITALADLIGAFNAKDAELLVIALRHCGLRNIERKIGQAAADQELSRPKAAVSVIRNLVGAKPDAPSAPVPKAIPSVPPPVKQVAQPIVARTMPKVTPKAAPAARKMPEPVSEPTTDEQFTNAVQRRCAGCPAVFKTKSAAITLCETCRAKERQAVGPNRDQGRQKAFIATPTKAQLMGRR